MGRRIIIVLIGLLLMLGIAAGIGGCKKTTLLEELKGITEGIGRWDEGSWDDVKFAE